MKLHLLFLILILCSSYFLVLKYSFFHEIMDVHGRMSKMSLVDKIKYWWFSNIFYKLYLMVNNILGSLNWLLKVGKEQSMLPTVPLSTWLDQMKQSLFFWNLAQV